MALIIFALFTFSYADLIQPVALTLVRPFSINQGYATDYSFSIYIPSTIYTNASIEVEFPQYYHLSSKCQAYIKIGINPFTIYSCSKTSESKWAISIQMSIQSCSKVSQTLIHFQSVPASRSKPT
jgi:hypothetical protein